MTSSRSLLLLPLLALALVLAGRFLLDSGEPAAAGGEVTSGAPAGEEGPPSAEPVPAEEPAAVQVPAPERAALAPPEPPPSPVEEEDLFLVEARSAEDDLPVAGALVLALDLRTWTPERLAREVLAGSGVLSVLERRSERAETDEEGLARLPRPPGPALLLAEGPEGLAVQMLPVPPGDRVTLALEPVPRYRVRVVDAGGEPVAGLEVELRVADRWSPVPLRRARTDAEGRAVLRAPLPLLGLLPLPVRELALGPAPPFTEPEAGPLNPAQPPEEEILLELPPTGSLRVEVRSPEGVLLDLDAEVLVHRVQGFQVLQDGLPAFGSVRAPLRGGGALFAPVPVGGRWEAILLEEGNLVPPRTAGDGPAPGGEAVLVLERPAAAVRVQGRVLAEDGRPAPEDTALRVRLAAEAPSPGRALAEGRIRTASGGTFRFRWDGAFPEGTQGLYFLFEEDGSGPPLRRAAVVRDPSEVQPGTVLDLGDLVLLPPRDRLNGVVRDRAGAPVAGASVQLEIRSGDSVRVEQAVSDAQGGFRFQGEALLDPDLEARLGVEAAGFTPARLPVLPGQAQVTVVLSEGARVVLPLDPPKGTPGVRARIRYRMDGGERTALPSWENGAWYWDALPPGPARLEFYCDFGFEPLAAQSLELLEGQILRLEPRSLEGLVRPLVLEVVDEAGGALKPVEITLEQGGRESRHSFLTQNRLHLYLPAGIEAGLTVASPGYEPVLLELPAALEDGGERRVVLLPKEG